VVTVDGEDAVASPWVTVFGTAYTSCVDEVDAVHYTVIGNMGMAEDDDVGMRIVAAPAVNFLR